MTQLEAAKMQEAVDLAAQHVGIKGHKVHAFLATLKMCGYELEPAGRGLSAAPPVTELTACGSSTDPCRPGAESPSTEQS